MKHCRNMHKYKCENCDKYFQTKKLFKKHSCIINNKINNIEEELKKQDILRRQKNLKIQGETNIQKRLKRLKLKRQKELRRR